MFFLDVDVLNGQFIAPFERLYLSVLPYRACYCFLITIIRWHRGGVRMLLFISCARHTMSCLRDAMSCLRDVMSCLRDDMSCARDN